MPHFAFSAPHPHLSKNYYNIVTAEDKSSKLQHHAAYTFHWQSKLFHTSDLPQSTDLRWQKEPFQSSCDQLCVTRFLIHLEGVLDWIIPHQVRRYGSSEKWKWSLACHMARFRANVAYWWVFTSYCNDCCRCIVLSAMLVNTFGTSTCFVIFEHKFMCFGSTFSYPHK